MLKIVVSGFLARRGRQRRSAQTRRQPSRLDFALYGCVPVVFTVIAITVFHSIHSFAGDFGKEFWPAGLRVLHGQSPYILGRAQIASGLAFPYPGLTALLFAPFALIAKGPSEALFTLLCFASLFAALRVLGVGDWRLYGIVLLWAPVLNAWQSANLTLPLALGLAVVWRYRDRPAVAGAVAALAVSLKPFVWPVFIWLLATRRFRAAAYGIAVGAVVNATAFAILGFGQISRYLTDAGKVSGVFFRHAYTPIALVLHLGLGTTAADAVGVVCALAAGLACVVVGRRRDDLGALALAVALTLLATPVLWMHYFALILVPLALARPRLEPVWGLPIVLVACSSRSTFAWQIVLTLSVVGILLATALRRPAGAAREHVTVAPAKFRNAEIGNTS
jgi:hypothetical protein